MLTDNAKKFIGEKFDEDEMWPMAHSRRGKAGRKLGTRDLREGVGSCQEVASESDALILIISGR